LTIDAIRGGRLDEAARWHAQACELAPDDPQLHALGQELTRHGVAAGCG
jgi:hypothetical protein